MHRRVSVLVMTHEAYRLELIDEVGAGWEVVLHPPMDSDLPRENLRTPRPDGLNALIAEARGRVERLLAGQELRQGVA